MPLFYGDIPLPEGCRWRRPAIDDREADRQAELAEAVTDLEPPERRIQRLQTRRTTVGAQRSAGRGARLDPPDPGRLRSR